MKLLVLGASGGCGRWVVRLAQEQGHEVTAVVRPSSAYVAPEGIVLRREEILEEAVLEGLLVGQQAVISCLGMSLSRPGNPFSRLLSPPDLMSSVARRLCAAAPAHDVERVISVSAGGVAESLRETNWLMRALIACSSMATPYADLAKMEAIYADSGLDWMAVRPVTLAEGGPTRSVTVVASYKLSLRITRGDVAQWMLHALSEPRRFVERTPMIAGGSQHS